MIKWLKNLFKRKETNHSAKISTTKVNTKETNRTIARMEQIKEGIIRLEQAYDKNLKGIKIKYDNKLVKYNKAYQHFQDIFLRYQNKMLSDAELEKEKSILKESENELNEQCEIIHEVEGYKAEEIKQGTDEMESLKDEYTDEMASLINNKATQLQIIKQQYINTLQEITDLYADAGKVEQVLNNNIQFESNLSETLNIKTSEAPLKLQDLTIEQQEIMQALRNDTLKKPIH